MIENAAVPHRTGVKVNERLERSDCLVRAFDGETKW